MKNLHDVRCEDVQPTFDRLSSCLYQTMNQNPKRQTEMDYILNTLPKHDKEQSLERSYLRGIEDVGQQEVEQSPKLMQVVLEGCSG